MMMNSPLLPDVEIDPKRDLDLPQEPGMARDSLGPSSDPLDPVAVPSESVMLPLKPEQVKLQGFGTACDVQVSAKPASGAMIRLEVSAPCDPATQVAVAHGAMSFKSKADDGGALSVEIPAFQPEAEINVTVPGREQVVARARVPDAIWYDRVSVVWQGSDVISIHAEGEGTSAAGAEGKAFLLRLGATDIENPQLAKIYSFPSGRVPSGGSIQLSVAAQVTEETCDTTIPLRSVRTVRGDVPRDQQVSVAFPGCEAVGQILVLKNILEDLKIARN